MSSSTPATGLDLDESAGNALDWARGHARQIGFGVLAIAAVAAVLWVVRAQNERNEVTASQQLVAAQRAVGSGNLPVAATELQRVINSYGSTRAGTDARILLAQVHLQQGKPDSALRQLDQVGTSGAWASSVNALRGAALEQSGKFAEAAAAYLDASRATVLTAEAESFKSDAARAHLLAGNRAEALKVWQGIAANPSSVLYNEALLRIGELSVGAPASTTASGSAPK